MLDLVSKAARQSHLKVDALEFMIRGLNDGAATTLLSNVEQLPVYFARRDESYANSLVQTLASPEVQASATASNNSRLASAQGGAINKPISDIQYDAFCLTKILEAVDVLRDISGDDAQGARVDLVNVAIAHSKMMGEELAKVEHLETAAA